jgi:hypothetical protein
MPSSIVQLSVLERSITGRAKIPLVDLESVLMSTVHGLQSTANAGIREYFMEHIRAYSAGGDWETRILDVSVVIDTDPIIGEYKEVVVQFDLVPKEIKELRRFTFDYDAVVHQVITHSILVFVENDWENGVHAESGAYPLGTIALDVPTGKINALQVDLGEGSWLMGVSAIFLLGMKHILEGLDHILFLLTLLIVAPLAIVGNQWSDYQGWRYAVSRFMKISLAFTAGHSITLLAGGFNLIDFRAQYIEVLIALSILVSAVNCIKPVFFKREILIAGGFGLIHGLAFSVSLSGMELSTESKLLSVLGFNLGIEAMQLLIMLAFFPVTLLSSGKFYPVFRTVFAGLTIVMAAVWIVERV